MHQGCIRVQMPIKRQQKGTPLLAAMKILLNGWAFYGSIGTEDTTVSLNGFYDLFAVFAIIKELAGIRGHSFCFLVMTMRTGNYGFEYNFFVHVVINLKTLL